MKTPLTLLLAACAFLSQAQTQSKNRRLVPAGNGHLSAKTQTVAPNSTYSFNTYTATYQSITGTSANNGNKWDEADYTIPLGFNFKLYNKQGTSIRIFGGAIISFDDINTSSSPSVASPIDEDLCDRAFNPQTDSENSPNGVSAITYTTTGTAPNRVCHIEVNNAGFWGEIDSLHTSTSFVSFQIRLFETSNMIEFHYGSCTVQHPDLCFFAGTAGFACDMFDVTSSTSGTGNVLTGPFASPTMVGADLNATSPVVISGQIQSGRVYQFVNTTSTSTVTAIQNYAANSSIKLYPNPAKDKLTITGMNQEDLQNATLQLRDLTGRLVYSEAANQEIHLPALHPGVYFVNVKNSTAELYNSKLIIAE